MSTSKLTDRTELTAQPANGDFLHVVDIDDTTGSAAGTSKKITVQNLMLAASGGGAQTVTVRNNTGSTITAGSAVYITGVVSSTPTIGLADNSSASTMPAVGVVGADIANNTDGDLVSFGEVLNLDTSSYSASDTLYVGTSGGLTTTKPTGTALIQNIGTVLKVSASTGSILVEGAGRSNDVPNIPDGQAWVGNASGVATPTTLGAVATGNEFTDLSDTPSTLTANQLVGVNSGGTALEFKAPVRQLNDLSDVTLGTISNGDVITYDSTSAQWRSQAPSGGGGGSNNVMKTFAFFDSNIRNVYIPMSNETEGTSMQRYNRFVCPVAGSVTSISFLCTLNLSGGTGGSIEVRKETTPGSYTTLETQSFSSVTAWTVTTLNFSSSSFSAGDRLLFFMNNGFSSAYSNITGTIFFTL